MKKPTRRRFLATCGAGWGTSLVVTRTAVSAPIWNDVRQSGPFVCRATFSLSEYDDVLAELPGLERELSRVLGLRTPRRPIEVQLMNDRIEHRRYLAAKFPNVPYRRALFVKQNGQARVFAYRQPELDVDLRHECTHALLHSDLAMVPLWLDEGAGLFLTASNPSRTCILSAE